MRLTQFDVVHVQGTVEIVSGQNVQVIFPTGNGSETRAQVALSAVVHREPGPVRGGDPVSKTVAAKGKSPASVSCGRVAHRDGDLCWVRWDDGADTIEDAATLTRL